MSHQLDSRSPSPSFSPRNVWQRLLHGPPQISNQPDRDTLLSLLRSYGQDYVAAIALLLIFGLATRHGGFRQEFSVNDRSIQHAYSAHERVPMWADVILSAIFPFLVVLLIGGAWKRSIYDVNSGILALLLTLSLTVSITGLAKLTVGRPRPDFLARCQLAPGTVDAGPPSYGLTNSTYCTQPDSSILEDGFKSFFSGHSSFAFAGLGFLSFYLAGKLHLWDRRGSAIKPWICGGPLAAAALVAISRVMDYRHHPSDVFVGAAVGFLLSWFVYRLYYPSVTSQHASEPYAPRIRSSSLSEDQTILPLHNHRYRENDVPEGTAPRPTNDDPWDPTTAVTNTTKYTDQPSREEGFGPSHSQASAPRTY